MGDPVRYPARRALKYLTHKLEMYLSAPVSSRTLSTPSIRSVALVHASSAGIATPSRSRTLSTAASCCSPSPRSRAHSTAARWNARRNFRAGYTGPDRDTATPRTANCQPKSSRALQKRESSRRRSSNSWPIPRRTPRRTPRHQQAGLPSFCAGY